MKKSLTKLLIISIICAIVTLILCYSSIRLQSLGGRAEQVLNEVQDMEADTPGAGEYLLIFGGVAALADFGEAIGYAILLLLVPGFLLLCVTISQCISRLVQIGNEKRWKNIVSKIFTYISIVLQTLLCIELIFSILSNMAVNKILLILALAINVYCVIMLIKEIQKNEPKP